ncbi:hypothetical protein VFES401_05870 [Aliivibrio fischeri]|uniref:hypothetical protein n=1 Tax=Aliivibrio fischeri TaxID=668 RepID=UPI00107E7FED|nr:hypothetical protein [Aliivibrio fischeri]TGA72007.1 hypothetical protein VFES401_05870 [Aliivibrio fischeri]
MSNKNSKLVELQSIIDNVIGLPVGDWPEFEIKWDESAESLHHYEDGKSPKFIEEHHPDGLVIADVNLNELDSKLVFSSRQTVCEFWKIGSDAKKARLIAHWVSGNIVTPCKITPYESEIFIVGGNHRLAISRIKNETEVPILFEPRHEMEISKIIQLKNIRKPQVRT